MAACSAGLDENEGQRMISFSFRKFALVAAVSCLTACSYMPKIGLLDSIKPSTPPEPPKPIRSIAIVNIAEPQSEQILNVGTAIGPSSDTRLSQPRIENSATYTQLLADRKTIFVPGLVKTLGTALTADGYAVSYLPDQHAFMTADGKSEDLTQVHADADAILIIRFTGAGYVSSPLERSYQPWVTLSARLLRNSNREEVYFKTFSGGYQMTADSVVSLPSSSRYRYLYFHDLATSVDQSIQGLRDSVNDIANYLAKDLFNGARAEPLPLPPPLPAAAGII
jgi:hypothetical protein